MYKICVILFVLILSLKNVRNADELASVEQPVDGDEACEKGDLRFSTESLPLTAIVSREEGENVELQCPACGYPRPKIAWLIEDLPSDEWSRADGPELFIDNEYKLKITELNKDDEGNYTCVLYNDAGSISHTYSVFLKRRIFPEEFISERPQNATVMVGDTHSFKCSASDPTLHVYWYPDIDLETTNIIESREHNAVEVEGELQFPSVSLEDDGLYSCLVTDENDNTAIASAYLKVIDAPWYSENWFYWVLLSILISFLLAGTAFIQIRNARRITLEIEMPEATT
ncbi:fibroblast growth factor receptor-like isoform X2 [Planococcus citri]|uniref:fibroblast growth factor receptor-like isoform X2 n=1 Tax=Planococcus citri TaxID=170843 RepID=UPI0031FA1751